MLPALLLGLASMLAMPLFSDETPPNPIPETLLPVQVSAATLSSASLGGTSDVTARVVERAAEYLRARRLNVDMAAGGAPGFVVSRPLTQATGTALSSTTEPGGAPHPVRLTIGFNSSFTPAAAGVETRFGGDGDLAWRLANRIQRNLIGGFTDVLGYDIYDRGAQEENSPPAAGTALQSSTRDPWVNTYPLFGSNSFEATIMSSSGSVDVIAVAISNAIADYLDPSLGTPKRTAQAGWVAAPSWQPVDPWAIYKAENSNKVALTFDGGASSAPTSAILKALRDAGVHATMFMTADFVDRNPDLVVQMAKDGHEFGNHSATHPDMTTISDQEIVDELDRLERSVVALTGKSTRPWFRPPFGAVNDRVLKVAASRGYYAVMWTTDSADWRNDIDAPTVASRMLRYTEPGSIMIEHLGSPQSGEVLADVLKALQARGLKFGTLSEVIGGQ